MSDRRGEIVALGIKDGTVICNVEDLDTANKTHRNVIISKSMQSTVKVPPIGAEVIVSKLFDGQKYIDGVISTPGSNGNSSMKQGSFSFVFDSDGSEKVQIEKTDSGYTINVDVDGKVNIEANGEVNVTGASGVTIDEGGTPKKVATEDHTHEYDWTDKSGSGTTSKPSDNTKTEIE